MVEGYGVGKMVSCDGSQSSGCTGGHSLVGERRGRGERVPSRALGAQSCDGVCVGGTSQALRKQEPRRLRSTGMWCRNYERRQRL